ncbi:hypothetical protein J7T55_002008 [Diaporthe amygdali]|uniref:uncharacterized protein n=1 Tax=Phomopsis amygdali TaxID=1214568 RepID=UPI0022FEEEF3|nr:uncharacterized protein J7T55_002008 [Diaporthe amygdali]KAJ0117808.1 hypothetical protein J7T55_002008 [Diaporthe amygdali]
MASEAVNEKATTPVATVQTTTQDVSSGKPTTTITTTETLTVGPEPGYRRPSEVSTPASANDLNPFDTDIEAMISTRTTREDDSCGMKSTSKGNLKGAQVWPGQDHWKKKAKANKLNQRSCQCLAKMSKRNRILVKVAIIVLVVLTAVGVGFGISKPLGAGIWKPAGN